MASNRKRRNAVHRRKTGSLVPLVAVMAGAAAVLGAIVLILTLSRPDGPAVVESSRPGDTTSSAVSTTASAAASGTQTGTSATLPPDVSVLAYYMDENGLLQFSTTGRYVQADTYQDGKKVPWNLLLVNDWNPLPPGYDDGVEIVPVGGRNQQVDARILPALNAMMEAGKDYGLDVQSGYRSASRQKKLYWRQVDQLGSRDSLDNQLRAGQVVKRPGYSEHNCGLAVDLGGSGNFDLETDFEETAAFRWLNEHCHEYGFILRFPKNKEDVTGVIYEPWHYRYVGKEAAAYIHRNGITLEEYLEQTRQ